MHDSGTAERGELSFRRAIKEALLVSNSGGQEIVEELDALALLAASPRGDPMSPSGWSQPMGWTRVSPLEPEAEAVVNLPKHVCTSFGLLPLGLLTRCSGKGQSQRGAVCAGNGAVCRAAAITGARP